MKVNILDKKMRVQYSDVLKMQLIMYCYASDISLSENEMDCMILLCAQRKCNLSKFCNMVVEKGIFKSTQTVRNFFVKAEGYNLIKKSGTINKDVEVSERLQIQREGNILLKYQILYVAEEK